MFKAGDRVVIKSFSGPIIEKGANHCGVYVGTIRTLLLGKISGELMFPVTDGDNSDGFALSLLTLEPVAPAVELAPEETPQTPTKPQQEAEDNEGNRMLAFFKASSHDSGASW